MATITLGGLLQCGFLDITDRLKNYIKSHCKIRVKQKKKTKQDGGDNADYQASECHSLRLVTKLLYIRL